MDARLQELLDKQEITERLHDYCRAIDRCDRELLMSVFHSESTHEMAGFEGSSRDFCGFAFDALAAFDATHHVLSNVSITVTADRARSECYFYATHRVPAAADASEGVLADHKPGIDEDLFLAGRYVDQFIRDSGVWKISKRIGVLDWCRWEPAEERNFIAIGALPHGKRDKTDPYYTIQ